MKLPIILLACVVLVALCNLGLDLRQPVRFHPPTTSAVVHHDDPAFEARIATVNGPAELRDLARREHARLIELHGWAMRLREALDLLNGARLFRNVLLFTLAIGTWAAFWRVERQQRSLG